MLPLPLGFAGATLSPEPLFILLLALLIDAAFGDTPALFRLVPHPVRLIGNVIGAAERKLNRARRGDTDRLLRGGALLLAMVAGAAAIGAGVTFLSHAAPKFWLIELFLTASLIAQRGLYDHVRAVKHALETGGTETGRRAVAHIVGRDTASLDGHGVARAAIESCAENFGDAVIGPVFWYVLLGFPGLLVYKTVNTLDSMIGHRSERYRAFGKASARFDDLLNLVPARLSGLLLSLAAAFVPRGRPGRALRIMLRDAGHHRSPNSGWPEAAMAGALDLALAGPRRYPGEVVEEKWIGNGSARATAGDIGRALAIYAVACLITAGLVAGLLWMKLAA